MPSNAKDIAIHVLQAKLDPGTIAEMYSLIKSNSSQLHLRLCSAPSDADVIITVVRMRKRLERHINWKTVKQKALVTPQWLRDSVLKACVMDYAPYAAMGELQNELDNTCLDCNVVICQCKSLAPHSITVLTVPNQQIALDYKAGYACQRASPLVCKNQGLVDEFAVLRLYRHLEGKDVNALAYERVIAAIKAYPYVITHENLEREVARLPGLGEKMTFKIKQFLEDGVISESQTIRSDESFQAMSAFITIHGVGPSTARHLYSVGLRSLEDMERYYDVPMKEDGQVKIKDAIHTPDGRQVPRSASIPTISIKFAIALRRDFAQAIPRAEAEEIHAVIMSELEEIQPGCVSTIAGGYRRGKSQCNDVDIVISHASRNAMKGLCTKLVQKLFNLGLVTHLAHLSGFHEHNALRTTHWDSLQKALTVFKLPQNERRIRAHRRLDLIFAWPEAYWTAVVGWTGSRMFERDLRLWAKKEKGMKFDSSGITRLHDSKLYYPQSEKETFDMLGLPWIDPALRNANA